MAETDCINIVVINCDGVFIEYEWKTVNDFLKDINNDNENIPMLDDWISTMNFCSRIFTNEELIDIGITTVHDFVVWCRNLPKVEEK